MRVKIFQGYTYADTNPAPVENDWLQGVINDWLNENEGIEIISMSTSLTNYPWDERIDGIAGKDRSAHVKVFPTVVTIIYKEARVKGSPPPMSV
jgi:hypothetical protein